MFKDSFLEWLKTNYPKQEIHPKFILQIYFNLNKITSQSFNKGTITVRARDASDKRFMRLENITLINLLPINLTKNEMKMHDIQFCKDFTEVGKDLRD